MSGPGRVPHRAHLLAGVAAIGIVLGTYANHFDNGFHFDDAHVILENLFIRSLTNIPQFFADATTFSTLPANQTYRPLLSASYAVDYAIAGDLDPTVFHVSQLVLHMLVGVGLFLLFVRVMDRAQPGPANRLLAIFGALWFCVHTANTETVNYLSARSDIISTLGIVWSFVVYLYVPASRRLHLYLAPMLLGALAKPPAVMFAPMLLAYVLLFEEEIPFDEIPRKESGAKVWGAILQVAPALVVGVLALLFVEGMNPEGQSYGNTDRSGYLRTQPWVWVHYARLFVMPVGLTIDTDWGVIQHWTDTRVVVGLGAILLAAVAAVRASRLAKWRPVSFGLTWFALGLLPASSFFPLAEVANEHRIYLPFAGLVLAAVWTATMLARRGNQGRVPVAWAVAGLVLLTAHVTGTVVRNRVWLNGVTLWTDTVEKSPENGRAWMNKGLAEMRAGQLNEARSDFTTATELWPNYAPLQVNLGIVTNALGDTAAAEAFFVKALELAPGYGLGHHFFGRYLVVAGRAPEAINFLRAAVATMPAYAPSRHLLLQLYYVIGSQDEVRKLVDGTLGLAPGDSTALAYLEGALPLAGTGASPFERGTTLTAQGRHLDAGVAYRRHLESNGPDPDAYLNLGWSQAQIGFDALAVISFQQALSMRPGWDMAAQNLAWVQRRMAPAGD